MPSCSTISVRTRRKKRSLFAKSVMTSFRSFSTRPGRGETGCSWREALGQFAADAPLLAQHAIEHALVDPLLDGGAQNVSEHVGQKCLRLAGLPAKGAVVGCLGRRCRQPVLLDLLRCVKVAWPPSSRVNASAVLSDRSRGHSDSHNRQSSVGEMLVPQLAQQRRQHLLWPLAVLEAFDQFVGFF